MTITLTRDEAQQVLDALKELNKLSIGANAICLPAEIDDAMETLRARLAQPEREWQGLTDEEILEEYRQSYGDDGNLTDVYFARAIDAKLKEKNA
jgi:hypothetical protein